MKLVIMRYVFASMPYRIKFFILCVYYSLIVLLLVSDIIHFLWVRCIISK